MVAQKDAVVELDALSVSLLHVSCDACDDLVGLLTWSHEQIAHEASTGDKIGSPGG